MIKRGAINVGKNIDKKNKGIKEKNFKSFFKKLFFYFIFLGFVFLVIWMLFFSDFMKVKSVNIQSETLSSDEIKKIVEENLEKKIFNYLSRDNLILISKNNIGSLLKERFKLIELVKVRKEFPSTISIEVVERKKVFIWCKGEIECALVDGTGKIFYKLNNEEKEFFKKDMVVVIDKSRKQIILNEKIVPEEVALFSQRVVPVIEEELGLKIRKEISIPSSMSGEITLTTEEGWKIHLNTAQSIKEQVEILMKMLGEDFIKEKRNDLEYIDLRLKGKVIYKFRGSENEEDDKDKDEDKKDESELSDEQLKDQLEQEEKKKKD